MVNILSFEMLTNSAVVVFIKSSMMNLAHSYLKLSLWRHISCRWYDSHCP